MPGRARQLPLTGALFVPGGLAVCGMPPVRHVPRQGGYLLASHGSCEAAVLDGVPAPDESGPRAHWTVTGALLGLSRPRSASAPPCWASGVTRTESPCGFPCPAPPAAGHIGEYAAWTVAGLALLTPLTVPGTHTLC
ncbi:hypothetical protein AN219_18225 [Streptomyces nanshensis]|nr:hypothetical protein AN219_18225 [Streptomyces nanshensis]